jgi:hypothetical protein
MPQPDSPLRRSIGLAGIVRWLIAVAATLALGAAFAAGYYTLAIAGILFVLAAVALAFRRWQARQAAEAPVSPPKAS